MIDRSREPQATVAVLEWLSAVAVGALVGLSGPLVIVTFGGFGLAAGPTLQGILVFTALLVSIGAAFARPGRRPSKHASVFALGAFFLIGAALGGLTREAIAPNRPAASERPRITFPSIAPVPPTLVSHASLFLTLRDVTAFLPGTAGDGGPEGLFGHSCQSQPGSETVAQSTGAELGTWGDGTVRAEVILSFYGSVPSGVQVPRIIIERRTPTADDIWMGAGRLEAGGVNSGRVSFDDLQRESPGAQGTAPDLPNALSGTISFRCREWGPPP